MNIKKKRILFVVGIMILVCCVFAGSYAFWTVTKEQTDTNNLVAACLDLELIEESGTFGVNNAWPISDEEGLELEGYSFKVKNNCSETVNYIIGIDSLAIEGAEYLDYSNIKVSLDSAMPEVFGSLTDVERDNGRGSKQVDIKTIEGNTTNSHNIKLWIKNEADVSEQSKQFKGQVFITGGQGIEKSLYYTTDWSKTMNCEGDEDDRLSPCVAVENQEKNNVTLTLTKDGELSIFGTGEMKSPYSYNYSAIEKEQLWYDTSMVGLLSDIFVKKNNLSSIFEAFETSNNNYLTTPTDELIDEARNKLDFLEDILQYRMISDTPLEDYNNMIALDSSTYPLYAGDLESTQSICVNCQSFEDMLTYYNITEAQYYEQEHGISLEFVNSIKDLVNNFPKITSINIGEGITNVGTMMFSGLFNEKREGTKNPEFKNITIALPSTVKNIEYNAFYDYKGKLDINEEVETILGKLGGGYIEDLYIPKVNAINLYAYTIKNYYLAESQVMNPIFGTYGSITNVVYPSGNYSSITFNTVSTISNLIIPENVTNITKTSGGYSNPTLKFKGPERTITGINLDDYNVVWNYTE